MIQAIINAIKVFFGFATANSYDTKEQQLNQEYAKKYQDINEVNVTAFLAKKLSRLAVSDSTVTIDGDTKRAEGISAAVNKLWEDMQTLTSRALGVGGVVVAPRVQDGDIVYDRLAQNRIVVVDKQGEKITKAAFLAETKTINSNTYQRWTCHEVENGNLRISTKVLNSSGAITSLPEWEFEDVIIPNVDRVLFSVFKCPTDNRKDAEAYGVPITYGAEPLIERYIKNIKEQDEEFDSKKGLTYVDERAFEINHKTGKPQVASKTVRAVAGGVGGEFIYQDHSPPFRVDEYLKRDNDLARKIEKEVGVSSGMLSLPEMIAKTATEVEISQEDTVSVVKEIQKQIANFIKDYADICDILSNYYGLTPMGEFELVFDFNTPFRDLMTEWQRRFTLYQEGAEPLVALRQYEYTNETLEESQQIIDEIEAAKPSLTNSLLGLNNSAQA